MRLIADENVSRALMNGLQRRLPNIDIVRVQEVGILGQTDPAILEWVAAADRLLISFDKKTVSDFAYRRVDVCDGVDWGFTRVA